jgi:hypothetical protein
MAMAKRLRDAEQQVSEAVRRRDKSPEAWAEWQAATNVFWLAYRDFHEDGVPDTHAAEVRAGDATATERAVRFLELDPRCFRSGYAKERLLRALKSARITQSQVDRLRVAMMYAVDAGGHRELAEWCRLAPRLDLRSVEGLLSQRLESRDPAIQRRARWITERLGS